MKVAVFDSVEDAQSFVDAGNKTLGLPRRGTHIGEGRHVDMPDEWDGKGECPPGWSSTFADVHVSDDGKGAVVPVADSDAVALLEKSTDTKAIDAVAAELIQANVADRIEVDLSSGYTVKETSASVSAEEAKALAN